jgi:nucleolar protein 15
MSKRLQRSLKAKIPTALDGPEWDSSDEEDNAPEVGKQQKKAKKATKASSKGKKAPKYDTGKNDNDSDNDDDEKNLVLYIGHLPKDFEEIDLRRFLTQFGKVYNCRVARKVETGNPKGFAFVRFGDNETAKIVCETLHGYFLEKQRLVCQLRPSHPGMFFDTDEIMSKRHKKIQLETHQRNKNLANSEKCKEITSRLVMREMKKRERLKALGIDFDFPGYKTNRADFDEEFVPEEEIDTPETEEAEATDGGSAKKKRRKESVDSTHSEGSAKKDKKKKRNSITPSNTPEKKVPQSVQKEKKKSKKRRTSAP